MWNILKIASAFIGIIVGAGFASGQEVLQYFTSFGHWGTAAAIVATALFAYLGMMLTMLGSRTQTMSHKKVIYQISGRVVGIIVDYVIIFTLFGVGVVMIAGAGSLLNQQFGLPAFTGSVALTVLVALTAMMNVNRVVAIIGSITPFLILALIVICVYSVLTMDKSFDELAPVAESVQSTLPHWFVSAINYVSFNLAVGAAMALVMGGAEKNEKIAKLGGLVGGAGVGVLIVLSHLALFSKIDLIADYPMPLLKIIDMISPALSTFMTFILFGMIFNTAVSMFYAFAARFVSMKTKKANQFIFATLAVGFVASFAGFTQLVAIFYPLIGYLGLFLVGALIYAPFKLRKDEAKLQRPAFITD
ncbi:hypothetical protein C9I92_17265 [Photobacterium ganghwense]|uniref:Membrane protein n=1 Tax=Photobacterium ganghwense TaxID=320778 RepID=A0A0J1H9F2_9GAMM|nr:membrane protein [Photobacterium ganghwense]KLV08325.1 membrane protein [Photobacterium ganghwense]PSU07460.1 hypothetical protein C9I92_17265 [Photobacterium ganghwense]